MRKLFGLVLHDPFAAWPPEARRWVRRLFWTLASVLILAFALSAVFALAMRSLPGYRQTLENYASAAVQRPLRIGDLALGWRGAAPSLDLQQVELLSTESQTAVLRVEQVRLGLSPLRMLAGDFNPLRIELSGLELSADIDASGELRVRGLEQLESDKSADPQAALDLLARYDEIVVNRCRLMLRDARLGRESFSFNIRAARLQQSLRGPRLALDLSLPETLGQDLKLEAQMRGELAQPSGWSGGWTLEADGLRRLPWLALLSPQAARVTAQTGQLRVQGQVSEGAAVRTDVQWRSQSLGLGAAALDALELDMQLTPQPFGWRAELQNLRLNGRRGVWPSVTGAFTYARAGEDGAEWGAQLSWLRLDDLAPWLDALQAEGASLKGKLRDLQGDVRALEASARIGAEPLRYRARAAFDGLALPARAGNLAGGAGFSRLSGRAQLDENGGLLELQDTPMTLNLPDAFSAPIPVDGLSAALRWTREGAGWALSAPQFRWRFAGSEGRGDFGLKLPGAEASPILALKAQFSVQDAARLKPYMPLHWGEGLREWLTRGLLRTPISKATLAIEGPLADFPYDRKPGVWSLDAEVAKADVFFAAGWPAIQGLGATLAFRGNGLSITAREGGMEGLRLEAATASFRDFDDGQLGIVGKVSGDLARYYAVLDGSPLRSRFEGLLKRTRGSGAAGLDLKLDIPLEDTDQTLASGQVALTQARLLLTDVDEPITDLRGSVAFSGQGIESRKLEGLLMGQPLTASITARRNGSALTAFWGLDLEPDSKLAAKLPAGLRARLSGLGSVRAQLRLAGADQPALVLDSDLRGLTMRLPAPLAKAAGTAAPLRVVIAEEPGRGPRLTVDWTGRLGADLRWRESGGRSALETAVLRLGREAPVFADTVPGLSLGAVANELSVEDWAQFFDDSGGEKSTLGSLPLVRLNLRAARWLWQGYALPQTLLRADLGKQGWELRLDGVGAEGEAQWQRERLQARLQHLRLEHNPEFKPDPARKPSGAPFDPARWPLLDVGAEIVEIAEAGFGALKLQTERAVGGQRLTTLTTRGGENELSASGLWLRREGRSSANLTLQLASNDFEGAQRAFGFGATLTAKATRVSGQLGWAPAAEGIAWQQARGDLALEFDDGALRGVEPGVGRVLGLLNFYALPRRLTLNFGDVADKGLAFDTVRGTFALADGQARTDNVEVKGPSLRIKMNGRAGLSARDYDQRVTVYPGLSTGFTLGAAALAGPIGAGLVFLAQEILDQPLEKLTQINYRVTGSWDDPKVSAD